MVVVMLAALKDKLKGFRTFISAGVVGVIGAVNVIGGIDLRPLLALFIADDKQIGAILVLLAIAFGILRYATTTAPGQATTAAPRSIDDGV